MLSHYPECTEVCPFISTISIQNFEAKYGKMKISEIINEDLIINQLRRQCGFACIDEGPLHTVGDGNPLENLSKSHFMIFILHGDPVSIVATEI